MRTRRPRAFPFEDGDLLTQCEDFQRSGSATAQEDSDGNEEPEEEVEHETTVVTSRYIKSHVHLPEDHKLMNRNRYMFWLQTGQLQGKREAERENR